MTLGEFRALTAQLDDNTIMFISNENAYEWYGTEIMTSKSWTIQKNKLTFDFGNRGEY